MDDEAVSRAQFEGLEPRTAVTHLAEAFAHVTSAPFDVKKMGQDTSSPFLV